MIDCSLTAIMALIGQAKLTGMHTSRLPNNMNPGFRCQDYTDSAGGGTTVGDGQHHDYSALDSMFA